MRGLEVGPGRAVRRALEATLNGTVPALHSQAEAFSDAEVGAPS
ncbi:hypothetical protein AB0D34_32880 [Streptomyces sp. NPDC048420]